MAYILVHAWRILVNLAACATVLAWLAFLLSYHERTKQRLFWWGAAFSLLAWTYLVSVWRLRW